MTEINRSRSKDSWDDYWENDKRFSKIKKRNP